MEEFIDVGIRFDPKNRPDCINCSAICGFLVLERIIADCSGCDSDNIAMIHFSGPGLTPQKVESAIYDPAKFACAPVILNALTR